MIKIKHIVSGVLRTNCYLVYNSITLNAIVIDPGEDGDKVLNVIKKEKLHIMMIINTHSHYDHSKSNDMLCDILKVKLAMHESEQDLLICSHQPEILFYDNQNIKLNGIPFSILHTPGHTKGSICLLFSTFIITGDTLFAGSIGRTDLKSGNETDMINSIKKLKKLNQNLIVYPGHGTQTTIKSEIKLNPYLCLNC